MMRYSVLGEKLPHTHSPAIHALLGNPDYGITELDADKIAPFFGARRFSGVNVTIPYKQTVMPLCDVLDAAAVEIGAVNTVVNCNGRLFGGNTDFDGFIFLCNHAGIDFKGKNILILGSGGTSKTVQAAARKMGAAKISIASRGGEINYENLYSRCADTEILVNTTPVGMFPDNDSCPVKLSEFHALCGVVDVIYNPLRTALITEAKRLSIPCTGGLMMLAAQAAFADRLFRGITHSGAKIVSVAAQMRKSLTNIVLIGMPGCGKSTVGKILAKELGRELIDLDQRIVERAGISIPEIFATMGEDAFRDLESTAAKEAAARGGNIIACGGGTVLREKNRTALKQNGLVVYIQRDIQKLATEGRPLSARPGATEQLFAARRPLYESFADITIDDSQNAEECAKKILSAFNEIDWSKS